jgi:hypothetical protein
MTIIVKEAYVSAILFNGALAQALQDTILCMGDVSAFATNGGTWAF